MGKSEENYYHREFVKISEHLKLVQINEHTIMQVDNKRMTDISKNITLHFRPNSIAH